MFEPSISNQVTYNGI